MNFDLYNVFNPNTVLGRNNSLAPNLNGNFAAPKSTIGNGPVGAANTAIQSTINGVQTSNSLWTPTNILQGRFYKISATFDF